MVVSNALFLKDMETKSATAHDMSEVYEVKI